jgi:hypothetical protein
VNIGDARTRFQGFLLQNTEKLCFTYWFLSHHELPALQMISMHAYALSNMAEEDKYSYETDICCYLHFTQSCPVHFLSSEFTCLYLRWSGFFSFLALFWNTKCWTINFTYIQQTGYPPYTWPSIKKKSCIEPSSS